MQGFLTPEQRSDFLFLDEGTIRNYWNRYVEDGIFGRIPDTYPGKRCHLADKEKEQLSNYLQSKICMDSKEILVYIQKKFDVTYSVSGVTALLHSMGFTYKKTKAAQGKAKKKALEVFIETYNRI